MSNEMDIHSACRKLNSLIAFNEDKQEASQELGRIWKWISANRKLNDKQTSVIKALFHQAAARYGVEEKWLGDDSSAFATISDIGEIKHHKLAQPPLTGLKPDGEMISEKSVPFLSSEQSPALVYSAKILGSSLQITKSDFKEQLKSKMQGLTISEEFANALYDQLLKAVKELKSQGKLTPFGERKPDSKLHRPPSAIDPPFSYWIHANEKATALRLRMIRPKSKLGEGSNKTVHKLEFLVFPLQNNLSTTQVPSSVRDKVIVRTNGFNEEAISNMISSQKVQKKLLDAFGNDIRIVKPFKTFPSFERKAKKRGSIQADEEQLRLEGYTDWYNGDFSCVRRGEATLSASSKKPVTVDTCSCLQIVLDGAKTLEKMHSLGYVHGDVKPGNFLITNQEKNNSDWHGHLADFDMTYQMQGENHDQPVPSDLISDYFAWDFAGKLGLRNLDTDVIGFASILGEFVFPDFVEDYHKAVDKIAESNEIWTIVSKKIVQSSFNDLDLLPDEVLSLQNEAEKHGLSDHFFQLLSQVIDKTPDTFSSRKKKLQKLAYELKTKQKIWDLMAGLYKVDAERTKLASSPPFDPSLASTKKLIQKILTYLDQYDYLESKKQPQQADKVLDELEKWREKIAKDLKQIAQKIPMPSMKEVSDKVETILNELKSNLLSLESQFPKVGEAPA